MGRAMKAARLLELARAGSARPGTVLELDDGRRVEVAWSSWGHGGDARTPDSAFVRELVDGFTGPERSDPFWLRPETIVLDWTPPTTHTPASAPVDPRAHADADPLRDRGQRGVLL